MNVQDLEVALRTRVDLAAHGDRLPPVRQLMREYKVGQAAVQEILGRMARQGLLQLQVGRGTFVHKPGQGRGSPLAGARVLVLSARVQSERSHQVARRVQEQLGAAGARCVQLVYERLEEALEVLRLSTRFDACVLQSYFDAIPLGLLSFLRERCGAVVVDGARVTGVDLDAVASDWRGALDMAIEQVVDAGHRRIALLAWPGAVQPLEGLRHHFVSLRRALRRQDREMPLIELGRIPKPQEGAPELVEDAFARVWEDKASRPTALLALGLGPSVLALSETIDRHRLHIPRDLSVVVLSHIDVADEINSRFDAVGSRSADAAHALVAQVRDRLEFPAKDPGTVYLANHYRKAGTLRAPSGAGK
ncbi:GntR family transcriptional regulator [Ideonella azotifigens]|uniref:GntR family transcriptional regulator n=1 Tax=Ideonella azotifigens TaxID=513160 RepID=UPI001476B7A9|nr:GntR family transcriptional regulator [Ideonella azotifigens]MCD2342922.1 GntR family transcriptional regulator [Ideonella azotifigens]